MDTIWSITPHTAAKHAILRRYLQAWFPKLTSFHGRVVFIDGFAGPGRYEGGEPGSPLVALEVVQHHTHDMSNKELIFLFVEEDEQRYAHLAQEIDSLATPAFLKIQHVLGSFDDVMSQVLTSLGEKTMAPAVIMIDPFGVKGMPLHIIEELAKFPKTEMLISFMYESMNRFMSTPEFEPHLDLLFGTRDWRQAMSIQDPNQKHRFMVNLYTDQLKKAGMEYQCTFGMKDKGNRLEYDLVFATHSIDGLKAIKEAMWRVDPSGSFSFSDATVSGQLTLFANEPDYDQLTKLILGKFNGTTVTVEEVESYVVVETAFRETHYKKQVLARLEKTGGLKVISPLRKRRYSYPAGTIIQFF